VRSLKEQLTERERRLQSLERQLVSGGRENDELLRTLKDQVSEREKQVQALEKRLMNDEHQSRNSTMQRDGQVRALNEQVNERERQVQALERQLSGVRDSKVSTRHYEDHIQELNDVIVERDKRINDVIAERDKRVQGLEKQLHALERQLSGQRESSLREFVQSNQMNRNMDQQTAEELAALRAVC